MSLSSFSVEKAKPREKAYKLSDGDGLHLLVSTQGSKLWRFRYRFGGQEKMLGFGTFPDVSLSEARDKRDEARKLVAAGTDPSQKRKDDRQAALVAATNTFAAIATELIEKCEAEGIAE